MGMEKMVEIRLAKHTDSWNMQGLIIVIILVGMIGLFTRSGGFHSIWWLAWSQNQDKKGAQEITWLIGILIFFDDYFNALTNGAIMRPTSDKFSVFREKLSYILVSPAVGICLVVPFSN